jgi:hypothetical protein
MHRASAGHAFNTMVFAPDEGPEGLEPNIERFATFLEANHVPASVQDECRAGTMAQWLGIDAGHRAATSGQ